MKELFKNNIAFLGFSLVFLICLICSEFIWPTLIYLKSTVFVTWIVNNIMYIKKNTKKELLQAKQCPSCNLFVPLDIENNKHNQVPHCCYLKPKELK